LKLFLDECVDRRLARHIAGHDVQTALQMGWTGVKNGALLTLAAARFDVFVTVDRNLAFQQNVASLPMPVIVLHAKSNRLADLIPLVPVLLRAAIAAFARRNRHRCAVRRHARAAPRACLEGWSASPPATSARPPLYI
jgi:hypothetical protein